MNALNLKCQTIYSKVLDNVKNRIELKWNEIKRFKFKEHSMFIFPIKINYCLQIARFLPDTKICHIVLAKKGCIQQFYCKWPIELSSTTIELLKIEKTASETSTDQTGSGIGSDTFLEYRWNRGCA